MFSGDIVDSIIRVYDPKISAYDQLTDLNTPIYIGQDWAPKNEHIHAMLRSMLTYCLQISISNL